MTIILDKKTQSWRQYQIPCDWSASARSCTGRTGSDRSSMTASSCSGSAHSCWLLFIWLALLEEAVSCCDTLEDASARCGLLLLAAHDSGCEVGIALAWLSLAASRVLEAPPGDAFAIGSCHWPLPDAEDGWKCEAVICGGCGSEEWPGRLAVVVATGWEEETRECCLFDDIPPVARLMLKVCGGA